MKYARIISGVIDTIDMDGSIATYLDDQGVSQIHDGWSVVDDDVYPGFVQQLDGSFINTYVPPEPPTPIEPSTLVIPYTGSDPALQGKEFTVTFDDNGVNLKSL